MKIFNSYVCPQCNSPFPIFITGSMRVDRGSLRPHLKCPVCGQVCRQKIDITRAVWVWPLTVCFFVAVIYFLRAFLYDESHTLYMLAAVITLVPAFIGYRFGLKLVKVEKRTISERKSHKWIIPVAIFIMFSILFGYYTGDWINVALGISVGVIVWAFLFRFLRRKENTKDQGSNYGRR